MARLRAALARKLRRLGAPSRTLRTADVRLMLAATGAPFDRDGWLFELKYDGFRLVAGNEGGRPRLRYRGGSDAPRGRDHTWVEPRVVCEVRYRERTEEGLLRHPVFVRFRTGVAPLAPRPATRRRR